MKNMKKEVISINLKTQKFMKKAEKNTKLFLISDVENKESILKDGIKSEDGEILLITKKNLAEKHAFHRVFCDNYSVFEIDTRGIDEENKDRIEDPENNEVLIYQHCIAPEFITHIKDASYNTWDLAEKSIIQQAKILKVDPIEHLEATVASNTMWLEYYNKKYGKNIQPSIRNFENNLKK